MARIRRSNRGRELENTDSDACRWVHLARIRPGGVTIYGGLHDMWWVMGSFGWRMGYSVRAFDVQAFDAVAEGGGLEAEEGGGAFGAFNHPAGALQGAADVLDFDCLKG